MASVVKRNTQAGVSRYDVRYRTTAGDTCRGVKLPALTSSDHRLPSIDELHRLADESPRRSVHGQHVGRSARTPNCSPRLRHARRSHELCRRVRAITVTEQITRGRHGEPVIGPPKSSAGIRTLTMPGPLAAMLFAHLERRGLGEHNVSELVFTMPEGGPLVYQNWRMRHWLPARHAVGLDRLGFHDLRRLNATGLVAEGIDVKTAQARLGHSDPRMTLSLYAQATTEADRSAADRLGTRFMGRGASSPPVQGSAWD